MSDRLEEIKKHWRLMPIEWEISQQVGYLLQRLETAEGLIGECRFTEVVKHKDALSAWVKAKGEIL